MFEKHEIALKIIRLLEKEIKAQEKIIKAQEEIRMLNAELSMLRVKPQEGKRGNVVYIFPPDLTDILKN